MIDAVMACLFVVMVFVLFTVALFNYEADAEVDRDYPANHPFRKGGE